MTSFCTTYLKSGNPKYQKKVVSMRILSKSIKCHTDDFKNKKYFLVVVCVKIKGKGIYPL